MPYEITNDAQSPTMTVTLSGDLNVASVAGFHHEITAIDQQARTNVVLDVSAVGFMDASWTQLLWRWKKETLALDDASFSLSGCTKGLEQQLEQAGFGALIDVEETTNNTVTTE